MANGKTGTVAFGLVEPRAEVPLTATPLLESIVPGTRIETYGREWVMAKSQRSGDMVYGRIGIVTEVDRWDDLTMDFHADDIEAGVATPYLLDTGSGHLVFQSRGSTIKPQSFVNAFEKLLNEPSEALTWSVSLAQREMTWGHFLSFVDSVERMTIRLERPNPRFPNELAEALVLGVEAAATTVTLDAGEDGAIDTDSEVIHALMEHADRYGHTNARGRRPGGGRVNFRGKRRKAQISAKAPADPTTGEIPPDELEGYLGRWSDVEYFAGD